MFYGRDKRKKTPFTGNKLCTLHKFYTSLSLERGTTNFKSSIELSSYYEN